MKSGVKLPVHPAWWKFVTAFKPVRLTGGEGLGSIATMGYDSGLFSASIRGTISPFSLTTCVLKKSPPSLPTTARHIVLMTSPRVVDRVTSHMRLTYQGDFVPVIVSVERANLYC